MPDNFAPTPGSGSAGNIATDYIGENHYQKIKLIDPTDESTTGHGISTNPIHTAPGKTPTATLANVAAASTSVTLFAENALRKFAILFNDSPDPLYLKYGTVATVSSFSYKILPYSHWTPDGIIYTGIITGLWVNAAGVSGNARTTDL